ncbi:MAG TPA: adenylate/guanylate cyclase domain-containing protein [Polyangiaceae bacterium]|nr:adenylate/guanylate cyclase domain-containing protein [Polyangiaceae bacterium]
MVTEADAHEAFERRLAREILTAERFRASLLAIVPTVAMLAFLALTSAYPGIVATLLHQKFDRLPVGLFLCAVAGFEFHVLYATERMLRTGERPSALRRYGYAFIETSLPTLVILYYATVIGPVEALLMPSAFVYFIFILLSTLRLDFALSSFTGLVAAAEYAAVLVFWDAFSVDGRATDAAVDPLLSSLPHHLGKACILLVAGISAGFVARRLRKSFMRAIESVQERSRILSVFGQHVSPEVVERLVQGHAQVEGELREVCVMFLDIRDFTAFAENRTAADVVAYLNAIFGEAVEAVVQHHGIVNKFLGDGFMAVFGAPVAEGNACASAIEAGLELLARVDRLSREGGVPPTRLALGLHAGPAVVGNIGSAHRKEYTVIGDVVNVASRVEALNRALGSCMLVTEEVWLAAGLQEGGRVTSQVREPILVRGRQTPVKILQLA